MGEKQIEKQIEVFDFDGTMYKTPVSKWLEYVIRLSALKLWADKIDDENIKKDEIIKKLLDGSRGECPVRNVDELMECVNFLKEFDETKGCDLLTYVKSNSLSDNILAMAKKFVSMEKPVEEGNHYISSILRFGFKQKDIEKYYRKFALYNYEDAEINEEIKAKLVEVLRNGGEAVVCTDNSKENVKLGLVKLGYDKIFESYGKKLDDVFIVDMFDCCGGATKKMKEGIEAFEEKLKKYCTDKSIKYDTKNIEFYDDSTTNCINVNRFLGIPNYFVSRDGIQEINEYCRNVENMTADLSQEIGPELS